MCGIFSLLNYNSNHKNDCHYDKGNILNIKRIKKNHDLSSPRGPEFSTFSEFPNDVILGFHRLAINGLDETGNQPISYNDVIIVCNGEIYNYKQLYKTLGMEKGTTSSDCEVIIHMYLKFGIKQTLIMLDGVFAFILYDKSKNKIYVARDPYGVRPLYIGNHPYKQIHMFASEIKAINNNILTGYYSDEGDCKDENNNLMSNIKIRQFKPGTYLEFDYVNKNWMLVPNNTYSYNSYVSEPCINYGIDSEEKALDQIYGSLCSAVKKRVQGTTERPIACLLSGGLDSSLIASLVSNYMEKHSDRKLETFSIGMPNSEDAKYAKMVAEHLGTNHTCIELSEQEFFDNIPNVIKTIESYDTTTVRASVGNYLVSKYIKEHTDAKVIFNGDGSDELAGGYLYFHAAPNEIDFDKECRRLLEDIHSYDVLRSDKSISSNGLEPRTPFLDRGFVQTYLSIPANLRYHAGNKQCEKYLIRKAFDRDFENGKSILPKEVLWRTKEAFSDGVSSKAKSWYEIIDEMISPAIKHDFKEHNKSGHTNYLFYNNTPKTVEQYYYRTIFEGFYGSEASDIIPYFWLPKWVNAKDSSARTLNIYKELDKDNDNEKDDAGYEVSV